MSKAGKVFTRPCVEFYNDRLTGCTDGQEDVPRFCWLGMGKAPTSTPVFEADSWLESWQVVASSVPSQQAKLSECAAQFSCLL